MCLCTGLHDNAPSSNEENHCSSKSEFTLPAPEPTNSRFPFTGTRVEVTVLHLFKSRTTKLLPESVACFMRSLNKHCSDRTKVKITINKTKIKYNSITAFSFYFIAPCYIETTYTSQPYIGNDGVVQVDASSCGPDGFAKIAVQSDIQLCVKRNPAVYGVALWQNVFAIFSLSGV